MKLNSRIPGERRRRWQIAGGLVLAAAAHAARGGEPPAGTAIVHPADQAVMVYVPAGEFVMGIDPADAVTLARDLGQPDAAKLWAFEAYPRRTLALPGYFIDKYEVTVEQWRRFVTATGIVPRSGETTQRFDRADEQALPAGAVIWEEAKRYAAWAGKALPTEAQWEKAARGTDGRLYPWGNAAPTPEHGHFGKVGRQGTDAQPARLYTWAGRHPLGASPCGALDMLGNQYEWTGEFLAPYPGNPEADRMKDYAGKAVCLRGGSWYHGWVGFYCAKRFGLKPDETYFHIGFRTVWTPPDGYFASAEFERARGAVAEREAQLRQMRDLAAKSEAEAPIKTPAARRGGRLKTAK
jgi:formylglycine-generating enzyme required for sulfatase activity